MAARTFAMRGRAAIGWGLVAFATLQAGVSWIIDRWEPGLRNPEYGRKLALLHWPRRHRAIVRYFWRWARREPSLVSALMPAWKGQ